MSGAGWFLPGGPPHLLAYDAAAELTPESSDRRLLDFGSSRFGALRFDTPVGLDDLWAVTAPAV